MQSKKSLYFAFLLLTLLAVFDAIVDTGEYIYENYVEAESDKISITHIVTIIGYDILNFYCAVGEGSTVTRIPQLSFLQNYMYTKK